MKNYNIKYTIVALRKKCPKVKIKQFTVPLLVLPDKKPLLCQIKNCKEKIGWIIGMINGKNVYLCFGHGKDL